MQIILSIACGGAIGAVLRYILSSAAIMFFAFFYTSIVFSPEDTADNLKKNGGFIPGINRFKAVLKLAALPKNGSKIRVRNRCEVTGRPRGNYRKFGMSRIAFRDLASSGQLPGITKASW